MKNIKLFLLSISFSMNAFALKDPALFSQFKSDYQNHYREAQCGPNIMGFVRRAESKGHKLYNANIIEISNTGYSLFGLVNAEFARKAGRVNPNYARDGLSHLPGEKNWQHHIILEMDGYIYDFDFDNYPNILPVKAYFEKMFLTDKKKSEGGDHYVGREEKLKSYEIIIRPALETIRLSDERKKLPEPETMRLQDYLKKFL